MTVTSVCPRCSGPLRPPGLMSSTWECPLHGAVAPYSASLRVTGGSVRQLAAAADVPVWAPMPLLPGWTLAGLARGGYAQAQLSHALGLALHVPQFRYQAANGPNPSSARTRATAVAFGGPSPLGGPADMVLVAEEPGVGLGARMAGIAGLDAGEVVRGAPDAKVLAGGHPTPLWRAAAAPDRAVFVGEALGVWLWAVLWPPAAELVLLEHVELHDLRHEAHALLDLPVGAPTRHLT